MNNAPPAGAIVTLRSAALDLSSPYSGYSSPISPDGSFLIEDIPAGSYLLLATAPGSLPFEYRVDQPGAQPATITLKPGQHMKKLSFSMQPKRVICGTVIGLDGHPVAAGVEAMLRVPGVDLLAAPPGSYGSADAAGHFRFADLPPGQYFLQALGRDGGLAWFPSSRLLNNAQPIEVGASNESSCKDDIQLRSRQGKIGSVRIHGTVVGTVPPSLRDRVYMKVIQPNAAGVLDGQSTLSSGGNLRSDNTFDFRLDPGRYQILLTFANVSDNWYGPHPHPWLSLASQEFVVADRDIDDLRVQVRPLASLSGRVRVEGITRNAVCPTHEQQFLAIQNEKDGQYQEVPLKPDGSFSFPYVDPGVYDFEIRPTLTRAVVVKSISLDDQPLAARRADLSRPDSHDLDIALSASTGAGHAALAPNDTAFERIRRQPAAVQAAVSGTVSGGAVGDVTLKLLPIRYNSRASNDGYSALPQPDGTFAFEHVDPGVYVLRAEGKNLVSSEYRALGPGLRGLPISLAPGQKLTGLSMPLASAPARSGVICGRVTNEDAQPVPGSVIAFTYPFLLPQLRGAPDSASVRMDSDGSYRISNLVPGKYFLRAAYYGFYPNSPVFSGAKLVSTTSDPNPTCDTDIRFLNRPPDLHRLRGKVSGTIPPSAGPYFHVTVRSLNPTGAESNAAAERQLPYAPPDDVCLNPDQSFDLLGLAPGTYRVRLIGESYNCTDLVRVAPPPTPSHILATADVTLGDADLDDFVLPVASSTLASISGHIDLQGDSRRWLEGTSDPFRTVQLLPAPDSAVAAVGEILYGSVARTQIAKDGSFLIDNVSPGTYILSFSSVVFEGRSYVASIDLDGAAVQGGRITVSGGPHEIKAVFKTDSAQLRVRVTPAADEFAANYQDEPCLQTIVAGRQPLRVLLISDDPPPDDSAVLSPVFTQAGLFELSAIRPGAYHLVAGENLDLPYFLLRSDPDLRKAIAVLGQPVQLAPGELLNAPIGSSTIEIQEARQRAREPILPQ